MVWVFGELVFDMNTGVLFLLILPLFILYLISGVIVYYIFKGETERLGKTRLLEDLSFLVPVLFLLSLLVLYSLISKDGGYIILYTGLLLVFSQLTAVAYWFVRK